MFTSTLYMIILCSILTCLRNIPPTEMESKSLRTKTTLVFVHIFCMTMACYTFVRHNTYCEDGSKHFGLIHLLLNYLLTGISKLIVSQILFLSVHAVCTHGIYGHRDEHELSHDCVLGLLWSCAHYRSVLWGWLWYYWRLPMIIFVLLKVVCSCCVCVLLFIVLVPFQLIFHFYISVKW